MTRDQLTPNTTGHLNDPADWLTLADGTQLRLRYLNANDREGLSTLFARLSPESRYRRFLVAKPQLTSPELNYLTAIDHVNHEAICAIDHQDGSIAGVARYVRDRSRTKTAELAVEVADELQGQGIGTALTMRIVQLARGNDFTMLTATTLWANWPARALLRRLGFRARSSLGATIDFELQLDRRAVNA